MASSAILRGRISRCGAHAIEAAIPAARLGDWARVEGRSGSVWSIVTAVWAGTATLAPLGDPNGIACGDAVAIDDHPVAVGPSLLGRAVDGLGEPLDGSEPPRSILRARRNKPALRIAERRVGSDPLWTGIRAIDGPLTIAKGARVGIFGPPGAGKSVLLERLAAGVEADAVVIALVGERGVEARARLAELDERTTLVCASSDRTAGERLAAGDLALAQAESLREYGLDVVVVFDSLARYAAAGRELALAAGEPAGRGGYPPSSLARLAALAERAGCIGNGSITLLASVLSDAGDPGDPLAEAARSYLDGHLILSRELAERGAFPAIDVPRSLSRTFGAVASPRHATAARRLRAACARLDETREARELGLQPAGGDLGRLVAAESGIEEFLRQGPEAADPAETLDSLDLLADRI